LVDFLLLPRPLCKYFTCVSGYGGVLAYVKLPYVSVVYRKSKA